MNKDKIKIKVLNPVGDIVHEYEIDWSVDQLDRFIPANRIIIESDEFKVLYTPSKPLFLSKQLNKDE